MIEDVATPGGYRIEGTLRIPIAINTAGPETKSAGQGDPDRRLRRIAAGGAQPTACGGVAREVWIEEAFAA